MYSLIWSSMFPPLRIRLCSLLLEKCSTISFSEPWDISQVVIVSFWILEGRSCSPSNRLIRLFLLALVSPVKKYEIHTVNMIHNWLLLTVHNTYHSTRMAYNRDQRTKHTCWIGALIVIALQISITGSNVESLLFKIQFGGYYDFTSSVC